MTLTPLSRTMHPDNLVHLSDEVARVGHARNIFRGLYRDDHQWRVWEYAICLAAAGTRAELAGKRCLDVGGSDSLFGPLLAWGGAHVTVNDASDHSGRALEMGRIATTHPTATPGGSLRFERGDFTVGTAERYDFVSCVSVIEHVNDDRAFFASLLAAVAPGGTLALTTDFDPSGTPFCTAHVRTYTAADMIDMACRSPEFASEGGFDYYDRGRWVLGYNFASLVLRRTG